MLSTTTNFLWWAVVGVWFVQSRTSHQTRVHVQAAAILTVVSPLVLPFTITQNLVTIVEAADPFVPTVLGVVVIAAWVVMYHWLGWYRPCGTCGPGLWAKVRRGISARLRATVPKHAASAAH